MSGLDIEMIGTIDIENEVTGTDMIETVNTVTDRTGVIGEEIEVDMIVSDMTGKDTIEIEEVEGGKRKEFLRNL